MRVPSSRVPIVLVSTAAAGIILGLVIYDACQRSRRRRSTGTPKAEHNEKSFRLPDHQIDTALLPAHLERDLLKERRWQRMMPKLAMKKPLYDNILMKDPQGATLCSVSLQKANWYVAKNLATWESEPTNEPRRNVTSTTSIRLLFTPRGFSSSIGPLGATEDELDAIHENVESRHVKQNRCVVCGRDDPEAYYMRHSIVPYCFRTQFPAHYKTHLPHDIVVLCADTCHVPASQYVSERVRRLEQTVWQSKGPPPKYIVDAELRRVKTAATTLLRRRDKLPENRIQEFERVVLEHYQHTVTTLANATIGDTLLYEASQLSDRAINPNYSTGAERIMESLNEQSDFDKALANFIREWRRHFLETMQPGFLPYGWSIESPVTCDDRS